MKTLEQLGISHAPWTNIIVTEKPFEVNSVSLADARLIAAAPYLYEALAAMISCTEKEAPFTTGSGMSIAMDMAKKAIKKAGGSE